MAILSKLRWTLKGQSATDADPSDFPPQRNFNFVGGFGNNIGSIVTEDQFVVIEKFKAQQEY